jgi:DNA-binding response OmpR family regulator
MVLRQLRSQLGRKVPALILSGDTSRTTRELMDHEGIILISKPADPIELLRAIQSLLG